MIEVNTSKIISEETVSKDDDFYNPANMERLKNAITDMDDNKGNAHDLIDD